MEITVHEAADVRRYEARDGAELAGFIRYHRLSPEATVFEHTEVDGSYEGRGVGSTLVRAALDDARTRGFRVLPRCPFVAEWIRRHPDYADLVAPSETDGSSS